MASDTKAATSRRKLDTETKTGAVKPAKKAASRTTAPAKTAVKVKAEKTVPAKAAKPAAKKPAAPRKVKSTGQPITADARLRHIEVAAYFIAEKSGFSRNPADCWAAAETEVDGLLLAGKL